MSTRHLKVDRRFCGLLHEDHPGIPLPTIERVFIGRPQRQAMILCAWAEAKTTDPASALAGWAAKHPTESRTAPRSGTTENRERVREGCGTGRTGWGAPLPTEQVAANLGRMAS